MIDYHVHPNYSIDAEGSLEQFCESALSRGLEEIGFTTHLDADREGGDHFVIVRGRQLDVTDSRWLEDYEFRIREIGDVFSSRGLKVLLGVELDCFPGVEEHLPENFFETDFDFVLGSVHLVDHVAISAGGRAERAFERYSLEELGSVYFDSLVNAVECGHIDILAHLDIYRRFGERFYGESIRNLWKNHVNRLSSRMKRKGIGFEVNTSPLRRGNTDPMPSLDFVAALLERGISAVTVGSDAHSPEDVGKGLNAVIVELRKLGLKAITRYDRRRSKKMKL